MYRITELHYSYWQATTSATYVCRLNTILMATPPKVYLMFVSIT